MARRALFPFLLTLISCSDEAPPEPAAPKVPSAPVRLVTDTDGITHIYGKSDADTFYGAGYAMARDRLFQMEVSRSRAFGRMAELFGKARRKDDIGARAFGFAELGRQDYERLRREQPAEAALLDAWTAGVNARIEEVRRGDAPRPYGLGPEELNFVPEAWEPFHGAAVAKTLAFGLSSSFESELLATAVYRLAPELASKVPILQPSYDEYIMAPGKTVDPSQVVPPKLASFTPPSTEGPGPSFAALAPLSGVLGERGASNNWAIEGSYSSNGRPLLAGDPHQALTSPTRLWPLHMSSVEGGGTLDVVGFAFAGTPTVQLGHNARVGWTATTNFADVMDMWDVKLTEDGSAVLLGGEARPVARRSEVIKIRDEGAPYGQNTEETVEVVAVPGFGILIPDVVLPVPRQLLVSGDAILFQWTGFQPTLEFSAYLGMDRARNVKEYEAAVDRIEVGAQNFVAADAEKILLHVPGKIPDRGDPSSRPMPWRILPGDDARTLWSGAYLGRDRIPHLEDPPSGYIATGNTDPWGFTADGNVENDPFYYGTFFATGFRPYRIRGALDKLLAQKGKLDRGDMEEVQRDVESPMAETLVPLITGAAAAISTDPALAEFQGRDDLASLASALGSWDRRFTLDSGPALLFLGVEWFAAKRLFEGLASGLLFYGIAEESPPFFPGLLRNVVAGRFAGASALLPPGGKHELMLRSLDDAAQWLTGVFGSADPKGYSLGKLHAAEFPTAYGGKLEIGRFPIPGSLDTINVSPAPFFADGGKPLPAFACTEMALYRMALQFGEDGVPEATFDLAQGSDENPGAPFFSNLQGDWVAAKHRPLRFRKAEVEAAKAGEVTLPAAP
jgi:penicillin amidase